MGNFSRPVAAGVGKQLMPQSPDKADMDTQPTMLPAALQAHEGAIGHSCPLGVLGVAVNADLQPEGDVQ